MTDLTIKRILVPTDFSDLATSALAYAREIAVQARAEIDVLYADPFLPPHHFLSTEIEDIVKSITHSKQLVSDELVKYLREHIGDAVPSKAVVVEDMPVSAILKHTEENDVDLIVMGTHGRGGLSRVMLGSVTERILRETTRPLLAVRLEGQKEVGQRPIERILCPVNFTEIAKQAAEYAISFARLLGAELTLLHIVQDDSTKVQEMEERLQHWRLSHEDASAVSVRRVVGHGDADRAVIEYAKAAQPNLIIIGAQHKLFFDTTVLGSTTVHVIRHAPSPVLTVVSKA